MFFDMIIQCFIDFLLKFDGDGILGPVQTYYGMVEAQNRGSLHLHAFIWLKNSVHPNDFAKKIEDKNFANRLLEYVCNCIKYFM